MRQAGFRLQGRQEIDPLQDISSGWLPDEAAAQPAALKKVLVLSYYNDPNFGDRLGYHLINSLLPANAVVTHASVVPWAVPDEDFDLLILGIGNSLNAATVARPELHRLIETTPHTLGLFGTQYRYQYQKLIDPKLIDSLDRQHDHTWWARYEEDINAFGRGRSNVRHLGDFLISAFPMATPTIDRTLVIPADIKTKEVQGAGPDDPADPVLPAGQFSTDPSDALRPDQAPTRSVSRSNWRIPTTGARGNSAPNSRISLAAPTRRTSSSRSIALAVVRYKSMVDANIAELRGRDLPAACVAAAEPRRAVRATFGARGRARTSSQIPSCSLREILFVEGVDHLGHGPSFPDGGLQIV